MNPDIIGNTHIPHINGIIDISESTPIVQTTTSTIKAIIKAVFLFTSYLLIKSQTKLVNSVGFSIVKPSINLA